MKFDFILCCRLDFNKFIFSLLCTKKKYILKTGHTAEFYLNHEEAFSILSHSELLKSFGASASLANEMLSDQGLYIKVFVVNLVFFSLMVNICIFSSFFHSLHFHLIFI